MTTAKQAKPALLLLVPGIILLILALLMAFLRDPRYRGMQNHNAETEEQTEHAVP